jgi:hypothetical protein
MSAVGMGAVLEPHPTSLLRGDILFPAAASCTKCEQEETINKDLSRCSRCKIVEDVKWVWT